MAKTIQVIIQQSNTGQIVATKTITVNSLPVSINRLDHLSDVDASGETEGATPIYDAGSDSYEVRRLDFSEIEGDPGDINITEIDGGTF